MHSDDRKVVIIAGATRSDAGHLTDENSPPLDRRFFTEASLGWGYSEIAAIQRYMAENYAVDILRDGDRLEQVMGVIYSDAAMPVGKWGINPAEDVFSSLLDMFIWRIAHTTNSLTPAGGGNYGRIIGGYLGEAEASGDITVITFNQDLQIEKAANELAQNGGLTSRHGAIFNFPHCYEVPLSPAPEGVGASGKSPLFAAGAPNAGGIRILKLHGSLNWFSEHNSPHHNLRHSLLDRERRLFVTRRMHVGELTVQKRKKSYTLPVIVPPVAHKAGVLHEALAKTWQSARKALREAREIAVFGYSCPEQDQESENLIRGGLVENDRLEKFSVIDPSSAAIKRYADLAGAPRPEDTRHKCLHFYRDARAFIRARFPREPAGRR